MKKIILKIVSVCLLLLMIMPAFVGCGDSETEKPGGETPSVPDFVESDPSFSYYPKLDLNADKKLYVFDSLDNGGKEMTIEQMFTAQAIQGLFAREAVMFYFDNNTEKNGVSTDKYWLDDLVATYGLTTEKITLNAAMEMYKNSWEKHLASGLWGSKIPLTNYNEPTEAYVEAAPQKGYETPGYILYRKATVQVNVVATLCGITGFLPVEVNEAETIADMEAIGIVKKMDLTTDRIFGYNWAFNIVKSELSSEGLIHQKYASQGDSDHYIKDVGIAFKYMHVYYDSLTNASSSFKKKLHTFLKPNIPILGYCYSESADVEFFSHYGQFIVPTDYSFNLTTFAAKEFRRDAEGKLLTFNQPNKTQITADPSKHYVTFIVSDGDNATMWQNNAPFANNMMGAAGRERDDFPVGWGITPSLADLAPNVLRSIYSNIATEKDGFVAPVCGQGYINALKFLNQEDGKYMQDFVGNLDVYLKKADLSIVSLLSDGGDFNGRMRTYEAYSKAPALKGGVAFDGGYYFADGAGGVYWSENGKPFITPRDSLWSTTPAFVAARLNMYPKDITSIEGYSIINVHPWSHTYQDIRTIAKMLDDSVEVVTPDQLFELVGNNVADKSNDKSGYRKPELNGVSVTADYLKANPELLPVDPLNNDFIVSTEDWTKTSGTLHQASSDNANSNVGKFGNSMEIGGGSVVNKAQYTLPSEDNLWISFMARANSNDPLASAQFGLKMTVDGTQKSVLTNVALRGVSGTETTNISGDGWQAFAFPVSMFFDDYKNKPASFELTTKAGVGIKLDKFMTTPRTTTPNGAFDAQNNAFDNKNTEDWLLGEYYTLEYHFWGAYNKTTGKPNSALSIDCSDGGGSEKRNANTNIWSGKTYTLPSSNQIKLSYGIAGNQGKSGAGFKMSINVDGNYYVLTDWTRVTVDIATPTQFEIDLDQALPGVSLSGKKVAVIFECRDSVVAGGDGEILYMTNFTTTAA